MYIGLGSAFFPEGEVLRQCGPWHVPAVSSVDTWTGEQCGFVLHVVERLRVRISRAEESQLRCIVPELNGKRMGVFGDV
jgi:hypothetical protein